MGDRSNSEANEPFWEAKSLSEMNSEEWESLCDGCGQCCILLLEDEDGEEEAYLETSLCCQLFDPIERRCTRYEERHKYVPECVQVTPDNARDLHWMPETCAYRLLAEGKQLYDWHPLISGRRESVKEAGIAVSEELTSERKVRARHYHRYVTGIRQTR